MTRIRTLIATLILWIAATGAAIAGAMSDYLETALIDHVFRGTAYTAPTTLYIGLSTTACSDSSFGTEVSGGGYARVGVAASGTEWAATNAGNGTTSNLNPITFPAPTADWGQVVSFFIADAATAGNLLVCSALTTPKTINNGDPAPSFGAGALTFQIDN